MSDIELFVGYHIDTECQKALDETNAYILETFIDNDDKYLKTFKKEGQIYLGKSLGSIIDFSKIESIESNIYSLLERIVNDYPFRKKPLFIITYTL